MRLTVGPLAPAIYWRRRGVVLVGLALVVLVIFYACGDSDTSNAGAGNPSARPTTRSASPTASPSASLVRPTTPPTRATPFTLPSAGASVPCADEEMEVTASAIPATIQQGKPVDVTITIKNISSRSCPRDIGADVQELRLVSGETIVWSSDDCNANSGHDVTTFTPGKQVSFTLTWTGRRSRTGTGSVNCNAPAPNPAKYALVARLDRKLSVPFEVHIEA